MIDSSIELSDYLEELSGVRPELSRMETRGIQNVALFLKHNYSYYKGYVFDHDVIFAEVDASESLNPMNAERYGNVLSRAFGATVVFVLRHIESYQRTRFIQRRVPFIVPGQQLYIPKLLIDLTSREAKVSKPRTFFRPATQSMLFFHLWQKSLNGMKQQDVAKLIGFSTMTISRAVDELEEANVLESFRGGISFIADRHSIWELAKPHLKSPVREAIFVNDISVFTEHVKSGVTALAHYTDLAADSQTTYAITRKAYKEKLVELKPTSDVNAKYRIEIWSYDPSGLSDTEWVDPFSLHTIMFHLNEDERVGIALDQLLEQYL